MGLSTFLNARPPQRLRGVLFLSLSDSAIIQNRTAASDSGGGASWAWTASGTVPCRVYPAGGGGPALVGGALDEATTHMCRMPLGATVTANDRLLVSGRGTFVVTMAPQRTGQLDRVVELMQV